MTTRSARIASTSQDATGVLVEVVAIDATQEDPGAVDEEVEALDLDPPEADLDRHRLGDRAVGIAQDDVQRVAARPLRRPALDVGDVEVPGHETVERRRHPRMDVAPAGRLVVREREPGCGPEHDLLVVERPAAQGGPVDRDRLGAERVGDPLERRLDRPARRQLAAREPDRDGQVERAGRQVVGQAGIDADVREVDVAGGVQEDRARDAAVPPLVLVLDVGRVRTISRRAGSACSAPAAGVRSARIPRRGASPCRRRSRRR